MTLIRAGYLIAGTVLLEMLDGLMKAWASFYPLQYRHLGTNHKLEAVAGLSIQNKLIYLLDKLV